MKKEPQLIQKVQGGLPVISREELIKLLQGLGFTNKDGSKYGKWKMNNYQVEIEHGSSFNRFPTVRFYHQHSQLHSGSDFAFAYNEIYKRLYNN